MPKAKPIYYVFRVEYRTCVPTKKKWIGRGEVVKYPNDQQYNVREFAGVLASQRLRPGEAGVRVTFLGLQRKDEEEITPMNPFTLILDRGLPDEDDDAGV